MTHFDDNAPFYKQKFFWMLMSGPIIVMIAGFITLYIALFVYEKDMVSDDYYKDGKHINLTLERDREAERRGISAQIFLNEDTDAAKIFISGDFDAEETLNLLFLHPAHSDSDQSVTLQRTETPASGNKTEYSANLKKLPRAVHWYVRLEDAANTWRIETKWLPSQGSAINLTPIQTVLH